MPVYGYELIGQPYKVVKSISELDAFFYKVIIIKAKKYFKTTDKKFAKSIKINKDTDFILARFDNNADDDRYHLKVKMFIKKCNEILKDKTDNKIFTNDDEISYILNLVLDKKEEEIEKKLKEFKKINKGRNVQFDITGSYENGAIILMKKVKK